MHGVKVVIVAALLALTGCAGVPQAPSSSSLDLGPEKTFTFRSTDADGNKVSDAAVANALAQAVRVNTRYKRRLEHFAGNNVWDVKGVEVAPQAGSVTIQYVNGERYASTGRTHLTRSTATFAFTAQEDNGLLRVKIMPPRELVTVKQTSPLFVTYDTLDAEAALAADVRQIYERMNPAVQIDKWVTGEVNAPFGVDAIASNFKRKCRVYTPDPQGGMTCLMDNQAVNVSVVPYQNGTKTTYRFQVQYRLDSNGGTTYSGETTKQMVVSIERIVKD